MSFLDNIGNFIRQRVVNPVGTDFSHLGGMVHNVTNTVGNDIRGGINNVGNIAHNVGTGVVNSFENPNSGVNRFSNIVNRNLYDNPYSIITHPTFRAITGKDYNQVNPQVDPKNPFEQGVNFATNFAGETAPFLAGEGEANLAAKGLSSIPKMAEFAAEHPKLTATGFNVAKNVLGGATQSGLQEAQNPKQYAKNMLVQGVGSAPFGVGGEFASPLLRAGQGAVQGLTSAGIMSALSGGKLQPHDLIQAGVPAAMALFGGKGNDEAALKGYLDQHPEVVDKLKNHPAVQAVSQLAKDNNGYINPGELINGPKEDYIDGKQYHPEQIAGASDNSQFLKSSYKPLNGAETNNIKGYVANQFPDASLSQKQELINLLIAKKQHENAFIDSIRSGGGNGTHTSLTNMNQADAFDPSIVKRVTVSNNSPEYQQALKDMGTSSPTKADWTQYAQDQLTKGYAHPSLNGARFAPDPEHHLLNEDINNLQNEMAKSKPTLQSTKDALNQVKVGKIKGKTVTLGDVLPAGGEPPKPPINEPQVNPGIGPEASKNFPFGFDANLHEISRGDSPDTILQKYVANRDTIRNSGRVLSDAVKAQAPEANDRMATYFTNEIKNLNPGEVEQFLNGTHPEYQKAIDEMTNIFGGKSPEEAKGAVKQYVDEMNKYYKDAITKGQNPTDAMNNALGLARQGLDYYLTKGREFGLFGSEVGKNDYLTHIIDTVNNDRNGTKNFGSDLNPGFQFAKQRIRPTIFHNLAHGEIPKHLDIANVVNEYTHKIASPLAMRKLMGDLEKSGMGQWSATPIEGLKQLGDITKKASTTTPDENGNSIRNIQDSHFYVRPDIADKLNSTFSKGLKPFFDQHSKLNNLKTYQRMIKTADFWGSIFHLPQMLSAGEASMVDPRKVVAGIKTQLNNPEYEKLIQLGTKYNVTGSQASDAREILYKSTPDLREDTNVKNFAQKVWGNSAGKVLDAAQKAGQATNKLIFENVQTPLKYYDFNDKFNTWIEKHPNASQAEVDKAGFDIGKAINAFYGGNNKEALGISKMADDVSRLVFLAPDWNLSKLKSFQLAIKGGAATWQARRYVAMQMGIYLASSALLNHIAGKDSKGNQIQVTPPVGGLASDIGHLFNYAQKDGLLTAGFRELFNKTNGFITTPFDLATNTTYAGRPISNKTDDPITATTKELGYLATQANLTPVPFSIQNVVSEIANNKDLNAKFQYSPGEIAYSAILGTPPIHVKPTGLTAKGSSTGKAPGIGEQIWGNLTSPLAQSSNVVFANPKMGQNDAAKLANGNEDYTPYITGIAKGGKVSPDILAGYLNYNGGFNGGAKSIEQAGNKLINAYNKTGNWDDALKSVGAKNANEIMNYKIPTDGPLNNTTNPVYASNVYDKNYIQSAINGTSGYTPQNISQSLGQYIVYTSKGKVDTTKTKALLQQASDQGSFGDWKPVMDQKVNQAIDGYQQSSGYKVKNKTAVTDALEKTVRFETGYDPQNQGLIDTIVKSFMGSYKKTRNIQDAISAVRGLDPNSNQAREYFNIIDSSSSTSGAGKQNWMNILAQSIDSSSRIQTATSNNIGLKPLDGSSTNPDLNTMLGMSLGDAIGHYNSKSSNSSNKSLASDTNKYFASQAKLENPKIFTLKGSAKTTGLEPNAGLATGMSTKQTKFAQIKLPSGKMIKVKQGVAKLSTPELQRILAEAKKSNNPVRFKPYIKATPLRLSGNA